MSETSPTSVETPTPKRLSKKAILAIAGGGAIVVIGGTAIALTVWLGSDDAAGLAMPGVGEQVARTSLAVGMCPNGVPERPVTDYDTVPIVSCDDIHREEVYAAVVPGEIAEWDADALRRYADQMCAAEFVERIGVEADNSPYRFSYYLPSEADWDAGYRAVACTLFDLRGPKTGPAEEVTPPDEAVEESTVEETEPVADEPESEPDPPAAQNPSPQNPAPQNPAPQNPTPSPPVDVEAERERLLDEIRDRNEQIDDLAGQKRFLVSVYEGAYGPYSPDGPLYLNGDVNDEIALKQQIDDVENEIRNLEADVVYLFGQLNNLPDP